MTDTKTADEIMLMAEKARFTLWPGSPEWAEVRAAIERVIRDRDGYRQSWLYATKLHGKEILRAERAEAAMKGQP